MSESVEILGGAVKRSETIGKLVGALALAQTKFDPVLKDSKNPYYNSKYADLSSVIRSTQGPLSENGLVVIQTPLRKEQDAGVLTMLAHSSGEWISNELLLPGVSAGKDGKPRFDAQSVGSAITYARRYSYKGIIGVADEDDDGNAAAETQTQQNKPVTAKSSAQPEPIKAPGPVNPAPATQGTRPESGQVKTTTVPALPAEPVIVPTNAQAADLPQDTAPGETLPTNEPSSPQPTTEQFETFKKRATDLRVVLEKSGLKPSAKTGSSPAMSSGAKLVKYFTLTAGVQKLDDLNTSQWNTVFSVLDALVNSNPAKAVELIDEKVKY